MSLPKTQEDSAADDLAVINAVGVVTLKRLLIDKKIMTQKEFEDACDQSQRDLFEFATSQNGVRL